MESKGKSGSRSTETTNDPAIVDTDSQPDGRDDFAAALDYDPDKGEAPRVVAKGKGAVARKILETAIANGVPVRRDTDLAQLLAAVELDREIPVETFTAVAEILSYIYRANGRLPRPLDDPERSEQK